MILNNYLKKRLIAKAKAGDRKAFEKLIKPCLKQVYKAAFYMSGGLQHEASDLAQETFVKAFISFNSFDENAELPPWLYRILRNLFLDKMKSSSFKREIVTDNEYLLDSDDPNDSPLEVMLKDEVKSKIHKVINDLPDEFKEIVVLCDIQQLSYVDASDIIGVPVGTIKSRLYRARLMLRKKLLKYRELF